MPYTNVVNYTPSGGPIAASAAPGSIGNGLTDVSGSKWSVDSSNILHCVTTTVNAWSNALLAHLADAAVNTQVLVKFVLTTGDDMFIASRVTNAATAINGYLIGYSQTNKTFGLYKVIAGTLTQITISPALGGTAPVVGDVYQWLVTTNQTTGSVTTITASLLDNAGTNVATVSFNDSTASLQNVSGFTGIFVNPASGGTAPGSITNLQIGIDTTTYNVVVGMNDASIVLSPHTWRQGAGGATTVQTWNTGAYARIYFTGATALQLNMTCGTEAGTGLLRYQFDQGPISDLINITNGPTTIQTPDTGAHVLWVYHDYAGSTDRWNANGFLGITSIALSTGATTDPAHVVRRTKNVLMWGDSIGEGFLANDLVGSSPQSTVAFGWTFILGQALFALGYEYGIVASGGQGYTQTGTGVPPLFTPGNDAQSTWNKYDANTSRLNGSGQFAIQPDVIIEAMGTNDSRGAASGPSFQALLVQFYQALRVACPRAMILKVIPYGGYGRSDYLAFLATWGDQNARAIDLSIDARMQATGQGSYTYNDVNHLHPGVWGHSNIVSLIGTKVVNTVSSGTGSSSQNKSFPGSTNL